MWTIQLPLRIPCDDRSKPVKHRPGWEQPYLALNLNQYRNAQFFTLNNAKVNFEIEIRKLIRAAGIPRLKRCSLEYILHPGTAQLCDIANICSIADKFFSDALKASKIVEDDNYQFLVDLRFRFGGIDRENPRVDVIVRDADLLPLPPERETEPMKIVTKATHIINLTKADIETALREFLLKNNIALPSETPLGELTELTDGTYELRVEVGGGVVTDEKKPRAKKEKLDPKTAMANLQQTGPVASPTTTTTPPVASSPAALSAKEQAAKLAEEMDRAEREAKQPPVTTTEAPQPATAETPEPAATEKVNEYDLRSKEEVEKEQVTTEVDHSPKTELEKKLEAVRGTPDEAEVKAAVEKERAIKADPIKAMQEAKTMAELDYAFSLSDKTSKTVTACYGACKEVLNAPPKKAGGLFSTMTRPSNQPK